MSFSREIGGYFSLELPKGNTYHSNAVALNSARNCFEYILRMRKPKIVYMPKFTCDVMLEPLQKLNIKYVYYALNNNLEIADRIDSVNNDELVVYTNYFGIKDAYSDYLSQKLRDRVVIDCSQAFYYLPKNGAHAIYSPRKFFGVADGGYVITDKFLEGQLSVDVSHERMSHLLKRIDISAEAGYDDFKINDNDLVNKPIRKMSRLTGRLLESIDYEVVRTRRLNNFMRLHSSLASSNELIIPSSVSAPMVYPYRTAQSGTLRTRLIENKVFVASYWPNVFKWCEDTELEYQLADKVLPLPIDQRYDDVDMQRILEIIYDC